MFELELKNTRLLKRFCKILCDTGHDINLLVKRNEVIFRSLKRNHIIMSELRLKKEIFSKYNVSKSTTIFISVYRFNDFVSAIKSAHKGLTLKDDNDGNLSIIEKQDNIERTWIFTNEENKLYPALESLKEDNVTLPFNVFKKFLSLYDDDVILSTKPGKFIIQSDILSEGKIEYKDPSISKNAKSKFRNIYLKDNLVDYLNFDDEDVNIGFDNESYLRLSFKFSAMEEMNFYTAPMNLEED